MNLKVLIPAEVIIDKKVAKLVAEASDGYFCILPRHIDFVSSLVPGLLFYEGEDGVEEILAIDEGILVKCASEVFISTRNAVIGPNLGELKDTVINHFKILDEKEKKTFSAIARLEADFIRSFIKLKEHERY